MKTKFILSLLFSWAVTFAFAQETTAEIQGIVKNGTAAVANATVKATHTPTGTVYTTSSRKDGRFNLANVKVGGPYTIVVSSVGFQPQEKEGVFLTLGQAYAADFALNADVKDLAGVTIVSQRQDKVINTNRTGSAEVVSRAQIERLPTINRSLQDFTKLTPSSNGLSFGGVSSSFNNLTVDGANFNNAFGLSGTLGGQTSSQPISIDAIEQIQVNISPFDVRQGAFSGAGINSVTRSGTNKFKGSVYFFGRNENTQGYKVRTFEAPKTNIDYSQFGGSLGGYIMKNKLFFFVSYEQEKIGLPGSPTFTAQRAGNPANNVSVSQAHADTLDKIKNLLVSKFGFNPGEYENYDFRTESKKATIRLDWNINSKNTFTIKYNYLRSLRDLGASNSGAVGSRGPSSTGLNFSGNGYTINNNFDIVIGELNTRFSNKANNKLQIGYSALRDFRASLSEKDFPLVDILDNNQTYTSFGYEPFTYNNKLNSNIFQLQDVFTFYKGSHEITVGTQNFVKTFVNGFSPNYNGYFRFNSRNDFYNAINNPLGSASPANAASLTRLSFSATKDGSFPFAEIGAAELGFFAQDKWRVKQNLTLTYGLRADLPIFQNKFTTNDSLSSLAFRDGVKVDVGKKPPLRPMFSPRVGFNWDVFNNKKTQIRGGIGLFAGAPPFVWISNQAGNNGVQFGSITQGTGAGPAFTFSPDVNAYRPPVGTTTAAPRAYNIAVTDQNFRYPQNMKASIGIDQKLPKNWTLSIEGNYTKDVNAVYFQNINLPYAGSAFAGADPRFRYSSPQIYSGTGTPLVNGSTGTYSNPNISDAILMRNTSRGYGYFATVQLQKQAKFLSGSVAYTYAKARTVNDGGSIAQSNWRDRPVAGDPNADDLGFANFNQPHRVIAYLTYRREYAKHFASSFGLTFEAATGGVSSYTYFGDINGDGQNTNDLMYIPRNQSEIYLVKSNNTDPRSVNQIWAQLDQYISQDAYLNENRGKIAERNGAVAPMFKQVNFNYTQDFFINTKDNNKHTLRLTFDIVNLGNLISKDWGIIRTFNRTSPLGYVGVAPDGRPAFNFNYLDANNQVPLTQSFRDNSGIGSRWNMQIGVRYLFN
jgi:hypothetical protein